MSVSLPVDTVESVDIRRPLGGERLAPSEPTRRAPTTYVGMGFPQALTFGGNPKSTARGPHLVAEDVRWEHGAGPLVTAPSSALIRALTGGTVADDELGGRGAAELSEKDAPPQLAKSLSTVTWRLDVLPLGRFAS